jgi:signal transduction histidine kinase
MASTLSLAIEAVKKYEYSFCKFVSPNDAGATGAHQAGLYIPKNSIKLLFNESGTLGSNMEKFAEIEWSDGTIAECRFIYYGQGTRNEYRITRLGKGLHVEDLVVIVKQSEDRYLGFILTDKNDISFFLDEFNITKTDTSSLIPNNNNRSITKSANEISEILDNKNDLQITVNFKPRARLLLQLGDQLIKNESIAIVELVKNSYDADANIVNVYMRNVDNEEEGIIIIEDDGYGMTAEIVEKVWLEPGSDFKSKKINNLEVSPKYKRLPIGEKGIGRFGVHKLGSIIEMTTKAAGSKEVFVRIDWTLFNDYKYLEDVPIELLERERPQLFKEGKTGTNITIRNLRKTWERGIARSIKRSITSLVSPFEAIDSFKPNFYILDKPGWFEGLLEWQEVKDYSLFHFKIIIKNNSISDFFYEFTPWASMPKVSGRTVGNKNGLIEAFKFLEDEDKTKFSLSNHKIGEITFEGYVFDLDAFVLKLGVSDKSGFKEYLRNNGGIRVFREGLRVYDYGEPENDWLDLDHRRFQQPTKAISNNLILAAIYLNRQDSSDLLEKTNREGFVENEAYEKFKNSILHCLRLVETLREKDKRRVREVYGPTPKSAPVMHLLLEAKNYVDEKVKDPEIKVQINKYLVKIEADYKRVSENLLKAAGAGLSMSVVIHEVEKIIFEVAKVLEVENASDRVLKLVKHLSSLIDGYSDIIRKSNQTNQNLKEVIDQALFNTEYRLNSHEIEVLKEYKDFKGNSKVKIARNLLIGSLMNIIDNAIFWLEKAFEANENLRKKILITLTEDSNNLNLIFADNGTGFLIPTDDITEPFVSGKPGGMGLGLHIASEIMEAQNGRLLFPELGDFQLPSEFKNGATIAFAFKK